MRCRCSNTDHQQYHNYGGRGITVCQEWSDFANFQTWALANGYQNNLTIDRKNNSGGYTPGNCRWANQSQQMRNRRKRNSKSGFIGVRPGSGTSKWQAYTIVNYKFIHLGMFDNPFSAAWIRDEFVMGIDDHVMTNNLTDRRKKKKLVMLERRGTFKRRQI